MYKNLSCYFLKWNKLLGNSYGCILLIDVFGLHSIVFSFWSLNQFSNGKIAASVEIPAHGRGVIWSHYSAFSFHIISQMNKCGYSKWDQRKYDLCLHSLDIAFIYTLSSLTFACSVIPMYWSWIHNLSHSLFLPLILSVCLSPRSLNSIWGDIYVQKINMTDELMWISKQRKYR